MRRVSRDSDILNEDNREHIVDTFINSIYVYDDKVVINYNCREEFVFADSGGAFLFFRNPHEIFLTQKEIYPSFRLNITKLSFTDIVDVDFQKWYNVFKSEVYLDINKYTKIVNSDFYSKTNNVFGGKAMTIYDEGKTLSFNVIGYESEIESDDYDWLMFRFVYSDGNSIEEYSDPSMTSDELIKLTEKMQKILYGEKQSLISKCFDDPAFSIAIIESHGEYAVAVHTEKYGNGEIIHRFDVREIMTRERFEAFILEMIAETKKFPCRH